MRFLALLFLCGIFVTPSAYCQSNLPATNPSQMQIPPAQGPTQMNVPQNPPQNTPDNNPSVNGHSNATDLDRLAHRLVDDDTFTTCAATEESTTESAKLEVTEAILRMLLGPQGAEQYLRNENTSDRQKQINTRLSDIKQFIEGMRPHATH
jgi:hypothetical protein